MTPSGDNLGLWSWSLNKTFKDWLKFHCRGWKVGSAVKAICFSSRGPKFNSQHPLIVAHNHLEFNNFLDKYHLPKLNQDQVSKLNRSVTAEEIETVTKSLPKKALDQMISAHNSIRFSKKN